ncbi:hypothetical protein AMAG_19164 [Allomyces macrogynus ATCC 38327]|uniref:Semialdehyde dehydrogenase NAD-binding domain-containing protein n=1 Tax=Allomyces macrogynus (strain ATCC 38327) TaxID=578462 RepID=A0A0L0SQ30_ALLM3|nr:hypothetical protein AMAG_19164 [Allomyces macrogynus ATCC 38327]|eukprot:KNE64474.1 hypothetical protein AMAG_19164 [Allomyces macrogynus ATCC 38327]
MDGSRQRKRGFATAAKPLGPRTAVHGRRSYSTSAAPKDAPEYRIGLIGARGFTGQELIGILNKHPRLALARSLSRSKELSGTPVGTWTRSPTVRYEVLSPDDVAKVDDVDAWVLALPNGAAAPWVAAIDKARAPHAAHHGHTSPIVVDLSADYRFADGIWEYGLVEARRTHLAKAARISNPGCYATGMQLALHPLARAGLLGGPASVFGVSGTPAAGTSTAWSWTAVARRSSERLTARRRSSEHAHANAATARDWRFLLGHAAYPGRIHPAR